MSDTSNFLLIKVIANSDEPFDLNKIIPVPFSCSGISLISNIKAHQDKRYKAKIIAQIEREFGLSNGDDDEVYEYDENDYDEDEEYDESEYDEE